jgi:transposase InsO family protein
MIDEAIGQLTPLVGMTNALATVGADRATWYRHHRQSPAPVRPRRVAAPQPRALSEVERKEVKRTLESDEFVDEAPATVYAKLLDQGTYLASVSTMYRVLHQDDEVRDRRRQATHPAHKKPELIATEPNSVWSWDITKLHGPEKWTYYYLYVILDIYSRYAVGWMLARAERAELSKKLISEYRPDFPDRFGSYEDGHAHCSRFFGWYNDDHRHSGIGLHTPADVHYGRAQAIREQRGVVLLDAYGKHPERFVRKIPTPPALPAVAWINQPEKEATDSLNQ